MHRTRTLCPAHEKNAGDLEIGQESIRYQVRNIRQRDIKIFFLEQCCGSGMFIADPGTEFFHPESRIRDPNFFHPGSWIRLKELKYFNPKKWFLSTQKYDPGFSSRIRIPDPDFLPIPNPGSRGQKGTGSRIQDPDPQHCFKGGF
jgi:hypothetical protein